MDVRFSIQTRIHRPVEEVFDHVVEPGLLSSYFTAHASGPLVEGAVVHWTWRDTTRETVHVTEVARNRRIVFTWRAHEVQDVTTVMLTFEPEGAHAARVTIAESGWSESQAGLDSAMEHCAGWQHMLLCLRARLQYGIDLRS
jgi:uncharacterized protein YndB with AHSA1/START domain